MKKLTIFYAAFILLLAVNADAQWTVVNSSTTTRLESMAVTDANTVYIVGFEQSSALNLKTTNGGLNWAAFASPSSGGVSVYFLNTNTGFLAGMQSLQMTTNAGNNWTTVYAPTDTVIFLRFHFPNANTGYGVGMVFNYEFNILNSAAIKTTNGGLNWTRLAPPIIGAGNELKDVFFNDANTGYTVGWGDNTANILLKTTNGGNNWNSIGPVYSGSEMYSVKFINQNTGYVCGSTPMGVLKTTNAGVTWNPMYNIGYQRMTDIWFINANTGFAIGDDGVVRTNDAGATWTNQNNTYTNNVQIQIMFYGDYAGYVCGKNGIMLKTTNGGIGVNVISTEIPSVFSLQQNYPNPFNPSTFIKFDVSKGSFVTLKLFDALGREVAILVNEDLRPGTYEADWNASSFPSGVYFYTMRTEEFTETKRMVLVK